MKRLSILSSIALWGCASGPRVADTQVIYAPAREPACSLELLSYEGRGWQTVGYVTLYDHALDDPAAPANLAAIRARACELGGTAVAVMTSYIHTTPDGDQSGSSIDYVVLRPRPASRQPTWF